MILCSPHCTDVLGDHVASIINVDETGNGKGNMVSQTARRHISKDIGVLCEFLVIKYGTLGIPGDVSLAQGKRAS